MDGQMHQSVPGQLQMVQSQVPPGQKPSDQPMALPASQGPLPVQRQMTAMQLQVKSHPMQGSFSQRDSMTYCAPSLDYIQRHPLNQPCHPVGKPYYGQPVYHAQQMVVNQPVPHVSPPSAQHQSLYFRPNLGVAGVFSKMQGSPHGWNEYRARMDQMQMYGTGQQGGNSALYVSPVPVDQRMVEFGSPVGISTLEGKRFAGVTHGYYGPNVQPYQQYMVPVKSSNMTWHSMDHAVQRTMDQQHKQAVHPANMVETGFSRHPSAMTSSIPGSGKMAQNYIPGKRLEHFSPGMQGCGPMMLSPSRQSAECLDEFSGVKVQPMVHGPSHSAEFASRQCQMYGPMLSPGSQFRQGASQRVVDAGGLHQGSSYLGSVYSPQMFVDAQRPRCHHSYPQQLQSPHYYQYIGAKPEQEDAGLCCNPESSNRTGSPAISNVLQSQICRDQLSQVAESQETSGTSAQLLSGPSATSSGNLTFTSASVGIMHDSLAPSLERNSCLSSQSKVLMTKNNNIDGQNKQFVFDSNSHASVLMVDSFSTSSSGIEIGSSKASSIVSISSCNTACLALADGTVSDGCFSIETGSSRGNVAEVPAVTRSDAGANEALSAATAVPVSSEISHLLSSSMANMVGRSNVVTQMASTSTTSAVTTSSATTASQLCLLTTAVLAVSACQRLKETQLSCLNPLDRQSDSSTTVMQETPLSVGCKRFPENVPSTLETSPLILMPMSCSMPETDSQMVKSEPALSFPRRKGARAKKKKVKLQDIQANLSISCVQEYPKSEANLTYIKLEAPNEMTSDRPTDLDFFSLDSSTMKLTFNSVSKELCLDESVLRNRDMPPLKNQSGSTPAPCRQKLEATEIKSQPAKSVTVPFGWKRKINESRVVYLSPTDVELESLDQIRQYLLHEGTCKCGLQCPLIVEKVFVFDPEIESRHLCADDVRCDMDMTNLCNHKRKIVAMATFQHSAGLQMNLIEGMQFRNSVSSALAMPSHPSSVGKSECCPSENFVGKPSHSSSALFVTANQTMQQQYFPGNVVSLVKPVMENFTGAGENSFCGQEGGIRWPSLMSPGGTVHGAKGVPRMETSGLIGSGSYLSGSCGPQTDLQGTLDEGFDVHCASSPHPNQPLGNFGMESPGYQMPFQNCSTHLGGITQPMVPQHVPPGYGSSRQIWPSFEDSRFQPSHFGRQASFGYQLQSKLRGAENMWTYQQPVLPNRVGQSLGQSYSSYAMTLEEQNDLLGARVFDSQTTLSSESWGQSASTLSSSKSVRKGRKKLSKKEKLYCSILEKSMPCPNIDVRQIIQEQQERIQVEVAANAASQQPSTGQCADNLTTFLAQQTALVNRTLPGGLGCASPADDSDVTQSASTICGSADDVASCPTLSGCSPLVDNSSFSTMPSASSHSDKKICDETEHRARLYSSSAETRIESVCPSNVSVSFQMAVQETASSKQSSISTPFLVNEPSTAKLPIVLAKSAVQCLTGSNCVSDSDLSSFVSTSETNENYPSVRQPGPEFGAGQLCTKVMPGVYCGPLSQNNNSSFSGLGMLPHQPPIFPYSSDSSLGSFASNWSYSNSVHSRNQYYFPSNAGRNAPAFAGTAAVSSNPNMMLLYQQMTSCSGRSEHYPMAALASVADAGMVPDDPSHTRPVLQTSAVVGHQVSEAYAHVVAPEDDIAGSGALIHHCSAGTQEAKFLEESVSGCLKKEESPITLVQNMVSGLVTTQNTLAMVTSMIISRSETSKRRKTSSCSDPSKGLFSMSISSSASSLCLSKTNGDTVARTSNISDCIVSSSPCTGSPVCTAGSVCVNAVFTETGNQSAASVSVADVSISELHNISRQPVPMTAITAVTNVTQVVPTASMQPSFGHSLHVPPIVQVLNPLNIALPGTSILLNDQVLAFSGQDSTILQQGLAVPGVGQLHIASHPPQSQMVVFPTGQGTTMVAIQPSQSALVTDFSVEEGSHAGSGGSSGGGGSHVEEEVSAAEEGEELEQAEADDMMRTTGTQTSTPASSFSNCNSLDSGENELETAEILCPDQSVSSSTKEDAGVAVKDGCSRRVTRKTTTQQTMASILQQGQMSNAQVVVMPSMQQQPFVLPQGVAFAGALGGQGYLQLQQPVDFGFSTSQVGLIHFGQITAAGGLIPTQALVGAMSVAGGGVVSTLAPLDRVVAPEIPIGTQNLSMKPDPGHQQAFGTAEILHLMSPSMPQGHILVQNMPTFAPFAGAILPVVPQAALGTAICNIGGAQTIFAVSQGSLGIVTSVASAAQQMLTNDRLFSDTMPEAPDSTVDSEDAITSNVTESDSVIASADLCQTTCVSTELCSSRDHVTISASSQARPSSAVIMRSGEESVDIRKENAEIPKESFDFSGETGSKSSTVVQLEVPDGGMYRENVSLLNIKEHLHVEAGPSFAFSSEQLNASAPVKLVRRRRKRKLKQNRRRQMIPLGNHSDSYLALPGQLEMTEARKIDQEVAESFSGTNVKCCSPPAESTAYSVAMSDRTIDENDDDDFSTDTLSKAGSSVKGSSASLSMECHVTTSLSCDSGDSSACRTERPRASRLRTKMDKARAERSSFSRRRHAVKRCLEEDVSKEEQQQDADDADSTTSLPSISYPRSFNVGDLVWGPARGFPSWPGKLVSETEVRGNPKTEIGKIWVKWFGDNTFTQADPDQLKTLSEGLETHHNARKKHRKGRRMNAKLEAAIQEAMAELDRQMVEQRKQNLSTSPVPDKTTPARHWGSRRTKK